jgi:hypothetical protein
MDFIKLNEKKKKKKTTPDKKHWETDGCSFNSYTCMPDGRADQYSIYSSTIVYPGTQNIVMLTVWEYKGFFFSEA